MYRKHSKKHAQNASGFSLIEIMIALVISSFLTLTLYQIFGTLSKGVSRLERIMERSIPLSVAYSQLERDCAGITLIVRRIKQEKVPAPQGPSSEKEGPRAPIAQEEDKEEGDVLFEYKQENGMMQSWTFISTNPLALYESVSPRLVRIRYRIKPDAHTEGLYCLERQESPQLPLKLFEEQKIRAYEVLPALRTLTVRFLIPEVIKEAEKEVVTFKELAKWQPESEKDTQKKGPFLPSFVIIEGVMVDVVTHFEQSFKWVLPVYSDSMLTGTAQKQTTDTEKKQALGLDQEQQLLLPAMQ